MGRVTYRIPRCIVARMATPSTTPAQADAGTAWTVQQIADRANVSKNHVANLITSGELPSVTIGRSRRILEADWLAYLAAHRIP